jgi:tetratricopeptide (TPR) repeat protein
MREMLTRLGERRALVVMIDDMQWADSDSLALLAEVLRPPEAPTMLLLTTMRASALGGETAHPKAGSILRDLAGLPGDVRYMSLSPLTDEEARELATGLLLRAGPLGGAGLGTGGGEHTHTAETIAREAGGHPFFIDALVRHAALTGGSGAAGLQEALWSSIASLDSAARRLMELVAVAPAPITQEALAAAADVAPSALGRHLARLRIGHFISVTGVRSSDTAEPYHDRVRAAVLAHLDPTTQAELHRALASALERTASHDVEALAVHWRGAGNAERAAEYAERAADAATSALAFDQAAKLYEGAIELGRHDPTERSALFERLGDALANAGRGARAAEAYAEASRGAQAARSLDLQRRGADQLIRFGRLDEGLAAVRRVLVAIGVAFPRSPLSALLFFVAYRAYLRVRGLGFRARDASEIAAMSLTRIDVCWSLATDLAAVDNLRGAAFQAHNLILALKSGEPFRIARGLALEAIYSSRGGGRTVRRTEALLQRTDALATASGEPYAIAWAHAARGFASYLAGRYRPALEHMDRAMAVMSEHQGTIWERDTLTIFSLNCLAQLGEVARAARELPKALREADQRGDLYTAVNLRVGLGNLVWLAADDAEVAFVQIDEAMADWSKRGFHLEHFYELVARANVLLYAARAREAHETLVARWPALRRSLLPFAIQSVRVYSFQARARCAIAAAEAGDARRAGLLLDAATIVRRLESQGMGYATSYAKLLRAGIVSVQGQVDRAAAHLRDAASGFDAADMALYAAATRRTLGKLVAGDEGRALVEQADAWMRSETVKNPARMTAMLAPGFAKLA